MNREELRKLNISHKNRTSLMDNINEHAFKQ